MNSFISRFLAQLKALLKNIPNSDNAKHSHSTEMENNQKTISTPTPENHSTQTSASSNSGDPMTTHHTFSTQGIELLKSIERLATTPYDDQTGKDITTWVKGATIGYGHLISKEEWPPYQNGVTEAAATALFSSDLQPFVDTVNSQVTVSVSQHQFDAMVILCFNIGSSGFSSSSVCKLVNDAHAVTQYANLEAAWKAWNKSQGQVSRGLANRRDSEWNIYSKGIYERW